MTIPMRKRARVQEAVREEPVKPSTVLKQEPAKPLPEGESRITRVFLRDQGEHPGMHQE